MSVSREIKTQVLEHANYLVPGFNAIANIQVSVFVSLFEEGLMETY